MTLKTQVRRRRLALDLTQRQLADATGISRGMIGMIETGARDKPAADIIVALAEALDCTPNDLLGWRSR